MLRAPAGEHTIPTLLLWRSEMTYIEDLFQLEGRTAIVTGGYGYLGRAMCWALAAAGAKVYCAGPSKKRFIEGFPRALFERVAQQYAEIGMSQIDFLPMDLRSEDSWQRALAHIKAVDSKIDILVNNAFYLSPASDPSFSTDMEGILNHTVALTEACLPLLRESNQARIINIASIYGLVAPDPSLYDEHPEYRSRSSYNAAKAALIQLTKYWASFWIEDKKLQQLTVNSISPGPFYRKATTEKNNNTLFETKLSAKTILKRCGQPEDLAGVLLLLASRAGTYITGTNMIIDGGWAAR